MKEPVQESVISKPKDEPPILWFYEEDGKRVGGVSGAEISRLINEKKLTRGSLIWTSGMHSWMPIENTRFENLLTVPPLPSEKVSNIAIWCLILIPIFGPVLEMLFGSPSEGLVMLAYYAINTIVCFWDESLLNDSGHDGSKLSGWVLFFVPAYLFKRSRLLKKKNGFLLLWIFAIFFSAILSVSGFWEGFEKGFTNEITR